MGTWCPGAPTRVAAVARSRSHGRTSRVRRSRRGVVRATVRARRPERDARGIVAGRGCASRLRRATCRSERGRLVVWVGRGVVGLPGAGSGEVAVPGRGDPLEQAGSGLAQPEAAVGLEAVVPATQGS